MKDKASGLRVSVVMPVYRAEAHLEKAVGSALEQPEVQEVVLVEDGSPDNSWAVCQRLAASDARVKAMRHPGGANLGAGESRNRAIAACIAPYVAFLDADDYYLPGRFATDRAVLAAHPDADGVYGAIGAVFEDEAARERFLMHFGSQLTTVRARVAPEQLLTALLGEPRGFGHFSIDALTVRREALLPLMPCFPPALKLHQDTAFLFRLAHAAKLYPGSIEQPVAMRRVHASNRITDTSRQTHHKRLFYDYLWSWCQRQHLSTADRRRLRARRFYWTLRDRPSRWTAVRALPFFLARPWLWRWVRVREELFRRIFGEESRAARALTSLTWRMLGDGGSYL